MAATIEIEELNGAGPAPTVITVLKHQSEDRYQNDATYPIQVPGSGSNYGFGKTLRVKASGSFNSLTNWAFYSADGTNGLGTGVSLGVKAIAYDAYTQATGTTGTTGNLVSGLSDLFTGNGGGAYTSASPLALTGSITGVGNGTVQRVVLQMSVASTAVAGTTGSETLVFRRDET